MRRVEAAMGRAFLRTLSLSTPRTDLPSPGSLTLVAPVNTHRHTHTLDRSGELRALKTASPDQHWFTAPQLISQLKLGSKEN